MQIFNQINEKRHTAIKIVAVHLIFLCCPIFSSAHSQSAKPNPENIAEPLNISYCELASDPAAYNHKLLRLTAFITHGFEDFHLADPSCVPSPGSSIWVMYGGKAESGTIYCCPGEGGKDPRSKPLEVEGVKVPLQNDAIFQQFTELLKKEPDTTVRATLIGRFFSGKEVKADGAAYWQGFGHLGCCSLFVIQNVERIEPHTRNDVDYTSEAGWYEFEGCKVQTLRYVRNILLQGSEDSARQAIEEQAAADAGLRSWAFNDPERVAMESLKPFYKDQTPILKHGKTAAARRLFVWKIDKKLVIVVVTRPYWLSFYSKTGSVVWVSTNIKEAECE